MKERCLAQHLPHSTASNFIVMVITADTNDKTTCPALFLNTECGGHSPRSVFNIVTKISEVLFATHTHQSGLRFKRLGIWLFSCCLGLFGGGGLP